MLYIFINPFCNGDLNEVSWNHTMKRFNCSPCRHSNAMFSLHSTGNACNVCVQPTTKMKSKYSLFISYESGKKFGITE